MMASGAGEDYEDFCVLDAPSSATARATAIGDTEDRIRSLDSRAISSRGQTRGYSTWSGPKVSSPHIVCESAALR